MMASLILVDYMFFEVSPPHVFDLRVSCLAFLECPALFVAGCGCAQQDNGMCKYRNGKCEITLFDYYCAVRALLVGMSHFGKRCRELRKCLRLRIHPSTHAMFHTL
jgi:hypothetical protein